MSRKICILHPGAWDDSASYSIEFVKALNKIKAQDTEYFVKACPPGPGRYPVVDYFMNALEIPKLCEGAMEAEKEGADAIVIACTDDPGLRVIRTLVDIPVIGEMESTLHLACMMGHRFGLVSWPTRAFMNRGDNLIRLYGLEANAVSQPTEPVVPISPTAEKETRKGFLDPAAFCQDQVVTAANKLINRGADVIVMHSTGLSLLVESGKLSKIDTPDASHDTDKANIPVLSVVSTAFKMAELRIDLQRSLGLPSASRFGLYQLAADVVEEERFKRMVDSFK